MRHLIALLLVLVAGFPAGAGPTAARDAVCDDVAAYFAKADDAIDEEMAALEEQPGFREELASGMEKNADDNAGFLALSPEEQAALIAYLRMPGEALAGIDPEAIPDEVSDLHDSAIAYWTLMPDMMQAIADESPSAAMPFLDALETATRDNLTAQDTVTSACPGEVTAWADAFNELDVPGQGTPEAELVVVWDRLAPDNIEGFGYPFLFFASDDASNATPAAWIRHTRG